MYFNQFSTVGAVKSEYRRLAKQYHPDIGGEEAAMKAINLEYLTTLSRMDGQVSQGTDGKAHTYHYNEPVEQVIMDKVREVLALNLPGVTVEIVGLWIWVSGTTREMAPKLNRNGAKMRWHSKREKWYWKPYRTKTRYSNKSFDTLRRIYGSRVVERESETALVPA